MMRRRLLLSMSALLLLWLLSACSNDDEITARYYVLDNNRRETSVFNYGDEMLFELIITNSTDQPIKKLVPELINSAFLVYNAEGQQFNPIPSMTLEMKYATIGPGEQFYHQLTWPWAMVPLPPGKYYSTYNLNIDKTNKTYTIHFEIK